MTDTPAAVESKPVYRTGDSVGAIQAANEQIQQIPVIPTPEVPATPDSQTPAIAPDALIAPNPITPESTENNVANFSLPEFEAVPAQGQEAPQLASPEVSWQEAIKKADATEVLKAAGVSEFAIEIDKHIKAGGDPIDYLNAKAVDYNKISDESLIKDDLRRQYPTFTPQQIDMMFGRKYGVSEDAMDEDKQFAELQLKADAHNKRQENIAKQQQFKIPTAVPQNQNSGIDQEQIATEQRRQMEETLKWYSENEATKSLMTSKRVAIDLGDDGSFNYAIDKPEVLMKGILDGETWRRMTSANPKESDVSKLVPDVAKLQRLVLIASNPNYEKDLVNYGKTLALPKLVEEGQNISAPAKVIPVQGQNTDEKDLWKTAKSSTVGGR